MLGTEKSSNLSKEAYRTRGLLLLAKCSILITMNTIEIDRLHELQGNLKDLTDQNYQKLLDSIKQHGFAVPVFVWIDKNGKHWLLDGHQRIRTLRASGAHKEVPYITIEAETPSEAKAKLLAITSQYGTITRDGLDKFRQDYGLTEENYTFERLPDYEVKTDGDFQRPQDEYEATDGNTVILIYGLEEFDEVQNLLTSSNFKGMTNSEAILHIVREVQKVQ